MDLTKNTDSKFQLYNCNSTYVPAKQNLYNIHFLQKFSDTVYIVFEKSTLLLLVLSILKYVSKKSGILRRDKVTKSETG